MSFDPPTGAKNFSAGVLNKDNLRSYEGSRFPVWVFDIDQAQVVWANEEALLLWEADSPEELMSRDMKGTMSQSVRERLIQYQSEFGLGKSFDEIWTLYPKGVAKPVSCRFRGFLKEDGVMAMLCEAQLLEGRSPALLRGAQALLYTSAMVTIYDEEGHCSYANPAALRSFSGRGTDLDTRILSPEVLEKLRSALTQGNEGLYISSVRTQFGERIHEIEARKSFDAVTGAQTLLLTEMDISEKEHAKRSAEHLASHDALTGVKNRYYFKTNANQFIKDALDEKQGVFLMLLDLDRFKFFNDTLGHTVGDEILKIVADKLVEAFPDESIIGRLGGDEFCVLLRSRKSAIHVSSVARSLIEKLRMPMTIQRHVTRVDTSIGISHTEIPNAANNFDELLIQADLALYAAKEKGGGTVRLYRENLLHRKQRFFEVEEVLRAALINPSGRLFLQYQPIVSLKQSRIIGVEALARLKDDQGEMISPGEFIPVAEATGLINELGKWVFDEALDNYQEIASEMNGVVLSINVSPAQFHNPLLLAELKSFMKRGKFSPKQIELELTETALHMEEQVFTRILEELVEMGYSLAIDDFGSAFSNISRLNSYPIQTLKIDRSMISHGDRRITAGIIDIGKALDLKVIVEGVETNEQRDWLIKNGCNVHQGFLYSRPVDLDILKRLLEDNQNPSRNLSGLQSFPKTIVA